jgi:transcription elongation factor Elf1
MERQLNSDQLHEDVYGNNAAVTCPLCSKVYIVSEYLNRTKGRACPKCGKSTASFDEINGEKIVTLTW